MVLEYAEECGASRVMRVSVQVGELCDFVEEYVQKYFDHLSKGTIAEGASIDIEWSPIVVRCCICKTLVNVEKSNYGDFTCEACQGDKAELVGGKEMMILGIEVQK